jgi:HAT1-interacting factor 1
MSGILAQVLGESTSEQKVRIQEATKNANDLSGLVKKKKPKTSPQQGTNGKRKLEEDGGDDDVKRAKTEELS